MRRLLIIIMPERLALRRYHWIHVGIDSQTSLCLAFECLIRNAASTWQCWVTRYCKQKKRSDRHTQSTVRGSAPRLGRGWGFPGEQRTQQSRDLE